MLPDAFAGLQQDRVLVCGLLSDRPSRRRAAEDLLRRLTRSGLRPHSFDLTASLGRDSLIAVPTACLHQELADLVVTDVILVVPPAETAALLPLLCASLGVRPRMIAFWDGPLDEPAAALRAAAQGLGAIWTPTASLAEIALAALSEFAGSIDVVACRCPTPLTGREASGEDRATVRRRLGLAEAAFVVGATLHHTEAPAGQNPAGLLAAFQAAFAAEADAVLLLACDGWPPTGAASTPLCDAAAVDPRIRLIDTQRHYLPRSGLWRAVDAWLALPCDAADRADIDDALAAGRAVVACARGLSARQLAHPALHPVRYARAGAAAADWVTPDIAHAAATLRALRATAAS
jgi:hypothetical protein